MNYPPSAAPPLRLKQALDIVIPFSGEDGNKALHKFITSLGEAQDVSDLSDDALCLVARYRLTGTARRYLKSHPYLYQEDSPDRLIQALCRRFLCYPAELRSC